MKTIVEAQKKLAKVIGKQKVKDTQYRLMNYVFDLEVEGGLLLYNVISGKMILLENEEAAWIAELPRENSPEITELIQDYYLVPVAFDEAKYVDQLRSVFRAMDQNKDINGYTILPTTNCNARCYYCYEANFEHKNMSEETADAVVEFIKKNHGDHKVSINWFGGEPTLGTNRIRQICEGLQTAEIEYSCSMISNGYLFDEEMVKEAVDLWNLKSIQITLDGTEEVYNKTKAYVSVKGSPFQRVMRNIQLLLDAGIFVSIRTNLSYANAEDLEVLYEQLEEKFSGYEKFHLYSHTLFDGEGFEPVQYKGDEEARLVDKQVELDQKIAGWNKGKKKSTSLPALKFRYCTADNSAGVVINPDGSLAKCEHFMELTCGDIYSGLTDSYGLSYWRDYTVLECTDCKLYPSCLALEKCNSLKGCIAKQKELKLAEIKEKMTNIFLAFSEQK